ncbi:hypothetical protein [Bernardetia sp.]|uniref:hypothetical protein n=1 Tax=Bernardetia sp. TaxID=1937974 RepID=UPI0025C3DF75|nr:hypothetical protein [Bernardetia sp.]
MNPIIHILGYLFHYANRDIPLIAKQEFYELKQKLLKKYGTKVGQDIQHIKKDCYSCDATGWFSNEWKEEPCWNCMGTGVYEEFWTKLDKYKLGKFTFHNPVERIYKHSKSFSEEIKPNIEGYISHKRPKYRVGTECAWWLFLFFDRKTFLKRFGKTGYPSHKRTPLVFLGNLIFRIRCFRWRDLFPKKVSQNSYSDLYYTDEELPF